MKTFKKIPWLDILLPTTIFSVNLFIQNYNLGQLVNVFTDEGVYLYSAKLLTDGLIPYKDFFLGQPFYILIVPAILLLFSVFNINIFHFLYTIWFFSIIFPLYFIIVKLTNNRLAAILALILFSTYQELVQWGTHQLDLRQTALPLLTIALFFIYVKPKLKIAAIFLAFFALSIVTNLLLSIYLILLLMLGDFILGKKSIFKLLKEYRIFILIFGIITTLCYGILFLIPGSFDNFILYQLNRPFLSYDTRLDWLRDGLISNWPIFLFGFLGSFIVNKNVKFLGIFNIIGGLTIVFVGSNFYVHYLTILAVSLTISSAVAISYFAHVNLKFALVILIFLGIFQTSFDNLKYQLIDKKTPEFFTAISIIKKFPGPLFTFEPIYDLYSRKSLTFHYNVADMRYFRVMGTNLTEEQYINILNRTNTVLIEPFAKSMIPFSIQDYIKGNFNLVYLDTFQEIYTRN